MDRISKFSFIVLDSAVLIIVLGLVYVVIHNTSQQSPPPVASQAAQQQTVISYTTSTVRESSEEDYYTITAEFPKFIASPTSSSIDAANAAIEKHVGELIAEFKKENTLTPSERVGDAPKSTMDYGFEIVTLNPQIISIKLNNSVYSSGAAHPNTFIGSFNYDVGNNKIMDLNYLFGSSDYSKRLSAFAETALRANLGENLQVEHPQITNEEPTFVIDNDKLVFTFNSYDVASYADGPQEITIPLEKFSDMLTPAGTKIFTLRNK